jgi:hypothetical protein
VADDEQPKLTDDDFRRLDDPELQRVFALAWLQLRRSFEAQGLTGRVLLSQMDRLELSSAAVLQARQRIDRMFDRG